MSETLIYKNNTGGCNLKANEGLINDDPKQTEFTYIQNMEFYRRGGFQSQKGNTQLNANVTDDTAILGIGEYRNGSAVKVIYTKASGKAYSMDIAGGTETEIKTGLNGSARPYFVSYDGLVVSVNGVNNMWHWNGTGSASDVSDPPSDWASTKPSRIANILGSRLLASAGSSLYWNDQSDVTDWTGTSDAGQLSDPYEDTSTFVTLKEYGGAVTCHTAAGRIYVFNGNTFSTYALTRLASNAAAIGGQCATNLNDYQFIYTGDSILPVITTDLGVVKVGSQYEISDKIEPFFTGTDEEIPLLPVREDNQDESITLTYDKKNWLVCYYKTASATTFDTAAIWDAGNNAWYFRKATPVTAAAIVNGKVITGTSDGRILEEFSDDATIVGGGDFRKQLISPWFSNKRAHTNKEILRHYWWFRATNEVDLTIRYAVDYNSDTVYTRDIQNSGSATSAYYGIGTYGINSYASDIVIDEEYPINMACKSWRFDLQSNSDVSDFRIIQYGFEVDDRGHD